MKKRRSAYDNKSRSGLFGENSEVSVYFDDRRLTRESQNNSKYFKNKK